MFSSFQSVVPCPDLPPVRIDQQLVRHITKNEQGKEEAAEEEHRAIRTPFPSKRVAAVPIRIMLKSQASTVGLVSAMPMPGRIRGEGPNNTTAGPRGR